MIQRSSNPSATGLTPGDTLGKYEVVSQIGAGAMSVVWKGYDKLLDRHVAIKQLSPPESEDDLEALRDRFRAEAHLQRRLGEGDKHLVRVIDFVDERRGLFIVMEYVEGRSLEQLLATVPGGGALEQRQALGIVGAAALALRYLHSQGVIHRDLKPSNILLPASGGLKICDFGIAALMEDQEALTVGSVRYMAPELFGDEVAGGADARADLYALGMIAYEMLAGRAKFEEAFKIVLRDQRNQALRWMKWHTNVRVTAPPLSSLNAKVPATLSDLVGRMMEKDPAKRIGSADELLDAIRRHFSGSTEGDSPRASPAGVASAPAIARDTTAPTAALPKRSKVPLILAAVLGLQVTVLSGWWVWTTSQKSAQARAVYTAAKSRYDQARALATANPPDYAAALTVFEDLARHWPDDPLLGAGSRSRALWCRANLAFTAGQTEEAQRLLKELEPLAEGWGDLVPNLTRQVNRAWAFEKEMREIDSLIDADRFDEARLRRRALEELQMLDAEKALFVEQGQRLEGQSDRQRVRDALAGARALEAEGKLDEAITALTEAMRRLSSAELTQEHRRLSTERSYRQALAQARQAERENKLAEAISAYQGAQKLRADPNIDRTIALLRSRQAFQQGRELETTGQLVEAAEAYTRALGYDEGNRQAAEAIQRLKVADQRAAFFRAGDAAMNAGDFEQAAAQYRLGLKHGDDPAIQRKLQTALVRSKVAQGQRALAQDDTDAATALFEEALTIDPNDTAARKGLTDIRQWKEYSRFRDSGDAYRKQSRYREAKRDYRKAREILDTPAIRQRLEDVEFESLVAAAKAEIAVKNWEEARTWLLTASRTRQTDEIRELLALIQQNSPAPTPAPGAQGQE